MEYFSATYGDAIKFNKKPNEDFYLISKKLPVFVVADGVTRSHFRDGRYSCAQGAKKAAQAFCKSIAEYLENNIDIQKEGEFLDKLKESFDFANEKIRKLNADEEIDKKLNYVEYDWLDTVGVACIIVKNKIYFGYVGDCGLAIFNKNNKKIFQTEDMVAKPVFNFINLYKTWKSFSANKRRYLIKRKLRNRDDKKGYGSFTGQEGVKNYYIFGSRDLNEQDMPVLYSDGFVKYLESKKIINILRRADKKELNRAMFWKIIKNPFRYGADRTFISVVF